MSEALIRRMLGAKYKNYGKQPRWNPQLEDKVVNEMDYRMTDPQDGSPPLPLPEMGSFMMWDTVMRPHINTGAPLAAYGFGLDPSDITSPIDPEGVFRSGDDFVNNARQVPFQMGMAFQNNMPGGLPTRGTEYGLVDPHSQLRQTVYDPIGLGDEVEQRMGRDSGFMLGRGAFGGGGGIDNPWLAYQMRTNGFSLQPGTAGYHTAGTSPTSVKDRIIDIAAIQPRDSVMDTVAHEERHALAPLAFNDRRITIPGVTKAIPAGADPLLARQGLDRPQEVVTHTAPAIAAYGSDRGKLPRTRREADDAMDAYAAALANDPSRAFDADKFNVLQNAYRNDKQARGLMRSILRYGYAFPPAVAAGAASQRESRSQQSPLRGLNDDG